MKQNVGNTDRVLRIILAIVLGVLYFTNIVTGTWGIVLVVVGAVLFLTALVGFCPLYKIMGINSRANKARV